MASYEYDGKIPNNITLSDSSFKDCPDTGRYTGSYCVLSQGGLVDYFVFLPLSVAMSSGEAE